jgi:hypothetical protein
MRRITIYDSQNEAVAYVSKDEPNIVRMVIPDTVSDEVRRQIDDVFDNFKPGKNESNFTAAVKAFQEKGYRTVDSHTGETLSKYGDKPN